ncbi:hypothetical protein HanIR_Chr12g0614291 [Helianthus annuus]|nr:hypothetical protein HanIR_Chr12g0614291 [Helianthus annuus]
MVDQRIMLGETLLIQIDNHRDMNGRFWQTRTKHAIGSKLQGRKLYFTQKKIT